MRHNSVHEPDDTVRRQPLVIATGNLGKLREFRALLAELPFEVVAQSDLGIGPVEETGTTFFANALLKARHAARLSGCAAIADDSGLAVNALGGSPGVYSARYAGPGADAAANNSRLLEALRDIPQDMRTARYHCALVFVSGPDDATPLRAECSWEGLILRTPRGTGGFGYDPLFWIPELRMSAAELDPTEKNRRSHRALALAALRAQLSARAQRDP